MHHVCLSRDLLYFAHNYFAHNYFAHNYFAHKRPYT